MPGFKSLQGNRNLTGVVLHWSKIHNTNKKLFLLLFL